MYMYPQPSIATHAFCVEAVDRLRGTSAPACFDRGIVKTHVTIAGNGRGLIYLGGPNVPVVTVDLSFTGSATR
jgi:hypothetical protein